MEIDLIKMNKIDNKKDERKIFYFFICNNKIYKIFSNNKIDGLRHILYNFVIT